MQIKTIETIAGINKIDFGNDDHNATAHFYWLKNLSDSTLYVSTKSNPIIGADDVAELPAKGVVSIETDDGIIYILGAGKVEIHRTDSKICPFKFVSKDSGGNIGYTDQIYYALKNAGYDISNDQSTWSDTIRDVYKDYDYRLDYSGTIFVYGGYRVTRSTDKLAYCGWFTFNGGYFAPAIIAADPEATAYTVVGYNAVSNGSFNSNDGTVYYCLDGSKGIRAGDGSEYNRRYLGPLGDDSIADIAQQLYYEIKILGYSLYE